MRGRPFYLELIVSSPGSFHGEGLDLVAGDFYFDAVGRAGVVALHDGAAHHDVAGQLNPSTIKGTELAKELFANGARYAEESSTEQEQACRLGSDSAASRAGDIEL